MQKLKHTIIKTDTCFTPQQWDVMLIQEEDLFMLIETTNGSKISGIIVSSKGDALKGFDKAVEQIKTVARDIYGSVTIEQKQPIKLACECKVCGKPFKDRMDLFEHYNETHSREREIL